jgi:hypothetical protein
MKLQRLAGYGPVAAFVSAAALLVVAVIQQVMIPPSIFLVTAIVFLVLLTIWVGALAVTLFDLEWLEHPKTSTSLFRVALVASLVAMLMPALIGLIQFAGVAVPFPIPYTVLFVGVGFTLLVHNIEARRAGLLHGALPWIGIAAGTGFIYLGVLQSFVLFTTAFVMGWYYGLIPTQVLYVVWTIWLGVHLLRAKAPRRVAAAASAAS